MSCSTCGMPHVQRVPRAGVVHVVPAVVRHQAVVGRVVDPLERQQRPEVVALGRVVVDDVEDDLDARLVQRLHQVLELLHLVSPLAARVFVVRRQVPDGVVAPVVAQSFVEQRRVLHELMDGQELDRGNPETLQVLHRHGMRHARVRATEILRNVVQRFREALDVRLVHDGPMPRRVRLAVVAPVEERIDHDGLRGTRRAVEIVLRTVRILEVIRVDGFLPLPHALDGLRVRVEHDLLRVAPQPLVRVPRAVHPIPVTLPRLHVGQVAVPAERCRLQHVDASLHVRCRQRGTTRCARPPPKR